MRLPRLLHSIGYSDAFGPPYAEAFRLSEDLNVKVLLIEACGDNQDDRFVESDSEVLLLGNTDANPVTSSSTTFSASQLHLLHHRIQLVWRFFEI